MGGPGATEEEHRQQVEALFKRCYGRLLGTATLILGDRAQAEDAVQDVFAALYYRRAALDDPAAAEGYLYRSVINACRSRQRRRRLEDRPRAVSVNRERSIEDHALNDDDARAIAAALLRLPMRQRECVIARYHLELSDREVAGALGISIGSVKKHLHRATRRLATLLEDQR